MESMLLIIYLCMLLLHCIFRIESAKAISNPDETFDKTHG